MPTNPALRASPPRIIPTERLISLCEESRLNTDRSERGKGLLQYEIGKADLPEDLKVRWLSILEGMYQKCDLLVATESYLKYNKARLIANRNKARGENYSSALPAFTPPEAYNNIQRSQSQIRAETAANIAAARTFSAPQRQFEGQHYVFDEAKEEKANEELDAKFLKNQQGVQAQFADDLAAGRKPTKTWLDLAAKFNVPVPAELLPEPSPSAAPPPPQGAFSGISLPDDNDYFGMGEDGVFDAFPAKKRKRSSTGNL